MRTRLGVMVVLLAAGWFALTALAVVVYRPELRLTSARIAPSAGPSDEAEAATQEPPVDDEAAGTDGTADGAADSAAGSTAVDAADTVQDDADPDEDAVEVVLTSSETYRVERGDTIASIADDLDVDANDLAALNALTTDPPPVGMILRVPASEGSTNAIESQVALDPALALLDASFDRWADTYSVPAELTKAIAWRASVWDPDLVGDNGQLGVGQLLPSLILFTETELLDEEPLDPTNADDGVQLMTRYTAWLLASTEGDTSATLAAYSQGLRTQRNLAWDEETISFIGTVLELRPQFLAGSG